MSNNSPHVLQQDESRSHLTDDPGDLGPEPTVIVNSAASPRRAERLAGEAGRDDIHSATPRSAVERFEVRPDRSLIQSRLAHPFHEYGRGVGVPLDVTYGAYPCHGSQGKLEPSVA